MCTFWFYPHSEASVRGHEIFNVYFETQLLKYVIISNNNNNNKKNITGK